MLSGQVEGGGSYAFLYPALLVVLFWLAFLSVFLFLVWFSGVVHVTACGRVISHTIVNRLKIPQGLSTLLFHRWSEVPSRGGVRGDSPYEKLPALQRCHLSVFSECCFLELLARPFSIRTLLPSGFVVLFCILYGFVLLSVVFVGLLSSLSGSF